MNPDVEALDADVLMDFSERIATLPPADAEWVSRLFDECLRARLHEAELLAAAAERDDEATSALAARSTSAAAAEREAEEASGAVGEVAGSAESPSAPPPPARAALSADLAQLALDTAEWLKTLWQVGYMGAGSFPSAPRSAFPAIELEDVLMSSLFARIRQGKRPLPFPPPTRHGSPWHELLDGAGEAHAVHAELVIDDDGQPLAASIDACTDWRVVEALQPGSEYLVQHQGKGPLFRLRLSGAGESGADRGVRGEGGEGGEGGISATLQREPPRWCRVIALVERGGFRSFVLHWALADGGEQIVPLRAATWERAEFEAEYWIAARHPEMYGQIRFEHRE